MSPLLRLQPLPIFNLAESIPPLEGRFRWTRAFPSFVPTTVERGRPSKSWTCGYCCSAPSDPWILTAVCRRGSPVSAWTSPQRVERSPRAILLTDPLCKRLHARLRACVCVRVRASRENEANRCQVRPRPASTRWVKGTLYTCVPSISSIYHLPVPRWGQVLHVSRGGCMVICRSVDLCMGNLASDLLSRKC